MEPQRVCEKWTTKKSERGEGRSRERDGKGETTDNPLLKNLRSCWWPQHSDWSVLAFPSTGLIHDGILISY